MNLNEVEIMSIYYSNSGNLIVPIVTFMLGEKWVFYACVFMGLQTIFFWTHCKNVLSHEKGFNPKKIFSNINIITQMCQVYDNDSRYASAINVLTTIGAIVTMPLMVFMYQIII